MHDNIGFVMIDRGFADFCEFVHFENEFMSASSNKVGVITLSFHYRRKLMFSAIKRKKYVHISASAKLSLETSAFQISATNPILCIPGINMFDLFDLKFCSLSPNSDKLCEYMGGHLLLIRADENKCNPERLKYASDT